MLPCLSRTIVVSNRSLSWGFTLYEGNDLDENCRGKFSKRQVQLRGSDRLVRPSESVDEGDGALPVDEVWRSRSLSTKKVHCFFLSTSQIFRDGRSH